MAEPILKMTRGVPKTDREWMDLFKHLTRFFKISGNELIIEGGLSLPDESVTTPKLAPDAVTNDKLRDSSATSVIGRSANSGGNPADIIATADSQFLKRAGGAVVFAAIDEADIPASIARDSEVSTAIADHTAASDPHPGYLTQTEGDARYRELTDAVTYAELTGKPAVLAQLYTGTGTPEANVTAGVGSLYLRTDGGAGTTLYVKESGAGNTGWVGK